MLTIDLTGKTALVIGGSRGIGAGITETLCEAGAYTVFTHTGNPENRERIQEMMDRIKEAGEIIVDKIDEDTDIVVLGNKNYGPARNDAAEHGILMVNEDQFNKYLPD